MVQGTESTVFRKARRVSSIVDDMAGTLGRKGRHRVNKKYISKSVLATRFKM